jgi:hypothetical protein
MSRRAPALGWPGPAALGALAAVSLLGCGGGSGSSGRSSPRSTSTSARTTSTPAQPPARAPGQQPGGTAQQHATSTSTSCVDATCEVRATCNGETHVRRGPAPVKTSSSSVDGRSTLVLDFAGSGRDAVIRC